MKFKINFDTRDKKKLFEYWDDILANNVWSAGKYSKLFEEKWSLYNNLPSVSFSSWTGAAEAVLKFFKLENEIVLCPSNTFQATPMVSINNGCKIKFVDANKEDLCISSEDLEKKIKIHSPKAIWVVHIGGHVSFDIEKIAKICKKNNIILIEDCAHSAGASFNGKKPGSWGDAGIYSLYATKSISTGEGGVLVSKNKDLIEFSKAYQNYGKPNNQIIGKNFRMNEFTAALGCIQIDRLNDMVEWKNEKVSQELSKFSNYLKLPDGMISGYYKFIVFDEINYSTGKVYDIGCHKIFKENVNLVNTDWINKNHWCVPIYYKG
jgi:dTDP-4-amino-4,6-dideoxygalactose transaminase